MIIGKKLLSYYTLFEIAAYDGRTTGLGSAILHFAKAKCKIADPNRPFSVAKHEET